MKRGDKGVWSCILQEDLEGAQYTFLVCINLVWNEAVDPYAKSVSENGQYGIVINMEKVSVTKYTLPKFPSSVDAILYEMHIRDMTMHPNSGVKRKGMYKGLMEENTKGKHGTLTALAHVKDLGVTHVEILPLHHFAGVDEMTPFAAYNWGYNPLYYNVPTGVYATNPSDPYNRMLECKQLIETFHKHGIRVIIDVVYNHVYKEKHHRLKSLYQVIIFDTIKMECRQMELELEMT